MTPGAVDHWAMAIVFVSGMTVGIGVASIVMTLSSRRADRRREAVRRAALRQKACAEHPANEVWTRANDVFIGPGGKVTPLGVLVLDEPHVAVRWLLPAIQRAIDHGDLVCHEPGNR